MIQELSKMSSEQKESYLKYYNDVMLSGAAGFKFLEPYPECDVYGLKFPIEYLNKVGKSIIMLPLEFMAEYADIITREYIDKDDQQFIFEQIIDRDINFDQIYQSVNATGIGNMAYICLNSKNQRAKDLVKKSLDAIFVKFKGEILNYMNETI